MSETKQSLKYIFTVTVCNIYMTDPGRDQFVLIYRMWRSVVCGSDGKLYGSDCLLMEAACLNQTNIHVQPLNRCQGLFTQLANCNSCITAAISAPLVNWCYQNARQNAKNRTVQQIRGS